MLIQAPIESSYLPGRWLPAEQAALTLPAGLTVSEWAAAHREFPKAASFPGRWDPQKAPYAVEPMDAFTDPQVERITLMASARSVKTEVMLNMLGYSISQDPGPALMVMPTENKVKRICARITKMIKASPDLRQHLTGNPDDLQKKSIVLKHVEAIFATAGSAADLGEFEARYIFESETDTYPESVGEQGSPTQMAEMRGRTFWNRKIVTESKPIKEDGFITKDYRRSDQRKFLVPCPLCGGYQILDFWQVKHRGAPRLEWPKEHRDPEYIKATLAAVYECRFCQAEIEEHHKPAMVAAGVWAALPGKLEGLSWMLDEAGALSGQKPPPASRNTHQGYWWNALYSPFATWSEMAAKYFEVQDDREQYRTFVNEWLGLPFKEVVKPRQTASLIEGEISLKTARPALEVPDGTVALTLGADNHKRGLAVNIWAWERLAPKIYNQHLIRYGWLADFQELESWLFDDVYYNREGSLVYRVWRGALDTGGGEGYGGDASLTEQAYEWLRARAQGRIWGIKGASRRLAAGNKLQHSVVDKMPGGKPIRGGLRLWILDTNALKEAFWARVEAGRVFFHGATGEDFARQLTAEAREWDQKKKQWLWKQQGNQANHHLDATIYAGAMADPECWGGLEVLPMPEPVREPAPDQDINPVTGKPRGSFWR
jgi:phage terminase large subunit GpA-like protein